jgi:tetratricopeptide (TPR) repeat protein
MRLLSLSLLAAVVFAPVSSTWAQTAQDGESPQKPQQPSEASAETAAPPITAPTASTPEATKHDEDGRQHFKSGTLYFKQGQYERAIVEYQEAYELSGRPRLLFNLSLAHEKLGQLPEAIETLSRYLGTDGGIADRLDLEKRLETMKERRERQEQKAARVVPSPAAAAKSVEMDDRSDAASPQPVYKKWWLWTGVGAVAVGVVVGAIVASSGGSSDQIFEGSVDQVPGPL